MPSRRVHFGVSLPQFGASWSELREAAEAAEAAGFDSVWVADHLIGIGGDDPLEAWTVMSALATVTRRVELGFLVLCNSFRPPPLVAKMAATLDHVSQGRLVVGLGAGWYAQEYEAYGYEFPGVRTRLDQLEESLEIITRMWREEAATFHGLHYHVEAATCRPKPVREPHPPILIGGGGEKVLLKLVAQYADVWNNLALNHAALPAKLAALRAHCKRLGRDPGEILVTQQSLAAIAADAAELERRREVAMAERGFLAGAPDLAPVGTPDEIRARVEKNAALGVGGWNVTLGSRARLEQIELFGREVIAAFR